MNRYITSKHMFLSIDKIEKKNAMNVPVESKSILTSHVHVVRIARISNVDFISSTRP